MQLTPSQSTKAQNPQAPPASTQPPEEATLTTRSSDTTQLSASTANSQRSNGDPPAAAEPAVSAAPPPTVASTAQPSPSPPPPCSGLPPLSPPITTSAAPANDAHSSANTSNSPVLEHSPACRTSPAASPLTIRLDTAEVRTDIQNQEDRELTGLRPEGSLEGCATGSVGVTVVKQQVLEDGGCRDAASYPALPRSPEATKRKLQLDGSCETAAGVRDGVAGERDGSNGAVQEARLPSPPPPPSPRVPVPMMTGSPQAAVPAKPLPAVTPRDNIADTASDGNPLRTIDQSVQLAPIVCAVQAGDEHEESCNVKTVLPEDADVQFGRSSQGQQEHSRSVTTTTRDSLGPNGSDVPGAPVRSGMAALTGPSPVVGATAFTVAGATATAANTAAAVGEGCSPVAAGTSAPAAAQGDGGGKQHADMATSGGAVNGDEEDVRRNNISDGSDNKGGDKDGVENEGEEEQEKKDEKGQEEEEEVSDNHSQLVFEDGAPSSATGGAAAVDKDDEEASGVLELKLNKAGSELNGIFAVRAAFSEQLKQLAALGAVPVACPVTMYLPPADDGIGNGTETGAEVQPGKFELTIYRRRTPFLCVRRDTCEKFGLKGGDRLRVSIQPDGRVLACKGNSELPSAGVAESGPSVAAAVGARVGMGVSEGNTTAAVAGVGGAPTQLTGRKGGDGSSATPAVVPQSGHRRGGGGGVGFEEMKGGEAAEGDEKLPPANGGGISRESFSTHSRRLSLPVKTETLEEDASDAAASASAAAESDEGRKAQPQGQQQQRVQKAAGGAGRAGGGRKRASAAAIAAASPNTLLRTPVAAGATALQSGPGILRAATGPPKFASSSSSSPGFKKPHGGAGRRSVPSGLPSGAGAARGRSAVVGTAAAAAAESALGVPGCTQKCATGKRRRSEVGVGGGGGVGASGELMPPPPPPPFLPLAVRPRRERKEDRDRDALARMARQQQVVATTIQGPVNFEMLPPYDTAPSVSRKQQYRQLRNLLLAAFPDNRDEVTEGVYRGREPNSSAVNESRDNVTCLAAGLWLCGEVVCAALVRMNTDPRSPDHLQVMFHATQPSYCRHGLGRLLIRCLQTVAAQEGHKYMSVVVGNDSVEKYWSLTDFQAVHQHLDPPDLRGVWVVSSERPPRGTIWVARLCGALRQSASGGGGRAGTGSAAAVKAVGSIPPTPPSAQSLVGLPHVQCAARLAEERFARAPVGTGITATTATATSTGGGGGSGGLANRAATAAPAPSGCKGSAAAPGGTSGIHHRRSLVGAQAGAKASAMSVADLPSTSQCAVPGASDVSRQANAAATHGAVADPSDITTDDDVVAMDVVRVFSGIAHPRRWIIRQAFKSAAEALEQDVAASGQEDVMLYTRTTIDGELEAHRAKLKISKIGNYMLQSIGPLLSGLRRTPVEAASSGEEGAGTKTGAGVETGVGKRQVAAAPLGSTGQKLYYLSLLSDGRAMLEYRSRVLRSLGPPQTASPGAHLQQESLSLEAAEGLEVEAGMQDAGNGGGGGEGEGAARKMVAVAAARAEDDGEERDVAAGRRGQAGSADAGGSGGGVAVAVKAEASDGDAAGGAGSPDVACQKEGSAVAADAEPRTEQPSPYGTPTRYRTSRRYRAPVVYVEPAAVTGRNSEQDAAATTSSDQLQTAAANRTATGCKLSVDAKPVGGSVGGSVGAKRPMVAATVSKGSAQGPNNKKRVVATAAAAGVDSDGDNDAGGPTAQANGSSDGLPVKTRTLRGVRHQKGLDASAAAAKGVNRDAAKAAASTQPQTHRSLGVKFAAPRMASSVKSTTHPPTIDPPVAVADAPALTWLPYSAALVRARNHQGDVTSSIILKDPIACAMLGPYADAFRQRAARDPGIPVWLQPMPYDVYYMLPARVKYYETEVPPGGKPSQKNRMWNLLSARPWLKQHCVNAVLVRAAFMHVNAATKAQGEDVAGPWLPSTADVVAGRVRFVMVVRAAPEEMTGAKSGGVMVAAEAFGAIPGVTAVEGGSGAAGTTAAAEEGATAAERSEAHRKREKESGKKAQEAKVEEEEEEHKERDGAQGALDTARGLPSPRDGTKAVTTITAEAEADAADPWIGPIGRSGPNPANGGPTRGEEEAGTAAVADGDLSPTSVTAVAVSVCAMQTNEETKLRAARRRVREEEGAGVVEEGVGGQSPGAVAAVDGAAVALKGRGKTALKLCSRDATDRQQQQQRLTRDSGGDGSGGADIECRRKRRRAGVAAVPHQQQGGGGGGLSKVRISRKGVYIGLVELDEMAAAAVAAAEEEEEEEEATTLVLRSHLSLPAAANAPGRANTTSGGSGGRGRPVACCLKELAASLAQELDLDSRARGALAARLIYLGRVAVLAIPQLLQRADGGTALPSAGREQQHQGEELFLKPPRQADDVMGDQSPPLLMSVTSPSADVAQEHHQQHHQQHHQPQWASKIVVRWVPDVPALVGLKLQLTLPSGSSVTANWSDAHVTVHFGELLDNIRLAEEAEKAGAREYLEKLVADADPPVGLELMRPRSTLGRVDFWHSMLAMASVPLNASTALLPSSTATAPAAAPAAPSSTRTAAAEVEACTRPGGPAASPQQQPQPLEASLPSVSDLTPSPPRPWVSVSRIPPQSSSSPPATEQPRPQRLSIPTDVTAPVIRTAPEGQPAPVHLAVHPPTATNLPLPCPPNPLTQSCSRPQLVTRPEEAGMVTAAAPAAEGTEDHFTFTKRPRLSASPLTTFGMAATATATADGGLTLAPTRCGLVAAPAAAQRGAVPSGQLSTPPGIKPERLPLASNILNAAMEALQAAAGGRSSVTRSPPISCGSPSSRAEQLRALCTPVAGVGAVGAGAATASPQVVVSKTVPAQAALLGQMADVDEGAAGGGAGTTGSAV